MNHAILVEDRPGEHWVCMCGKWRYDNDVCLSDEEVVAVVREHVKHIEAEEA